MDEREIIGIFQKSLGIDTFEDVETFEAAKGTMAVNTDAISESSDVPPGSGLRNAGYRSVASCVSDFAAKGIRPEYGVIAVTIPDAFTPQDVRLLSEGMADAAGEFGIRILGGDTGRGREMVAQVTLFGSSGGAVRRRGARTGDRIYATGPFGYTAAGLKILMEGLPDSGEFAARAKSAVLRPRPPLEFGTRYTELATSSMDSSDGLATCLNEMARQSDRMFLVDSLPAAEGAAGFAQQHGLDTAEMVLYGGGEYEIVFTAPPEAGQRLAELAQSTGVHLYIIGTVLSGSGVYRDLGGRRVAVTDRGWRRF